MLSLIVPISVQKKQGSQTKVPIGTGLTLKLQCGMQVSKTVSVLLIVLLGAGLIPYVRLDPIKS